MTHRTYSDPLARSSALYRAPNGHRNRIAPTPRIASHARLYAAIRELETEGVLTAHEAGRARNRIAAKVVHVERKA